MQLIKEPIVLDSRQSKPDNLAAVVQPTNLPVYDSAQIAIVYAHVIRSFKRPKLVERPERVKYCVMNEYGIGFNLIDAGRTNGRKMIDTISSSFSVSAIARPPSRGTMMPARNAPKIA